MPQAREVDLVTAVAPPRGRVGVGEGHPTLVIVVGPSCDEGFTYPRTRAREWAIGLSQSVTHLITRPSSVESADHCRDRTHTCFGRSAGVVPVLPADAVALFDLFSGQSVVHLELDALFHREDPAVAKVDDVGIGGKNQLSARIALELA